MLTACARAAGGGRQVPAGLFGGRRRPVRPRSGRRRAAALTSSCWSSRPGWVFGEGTSGEGCDAADLNLPGHQPALVRAVLETGRPVVLVSISGRPYALGRYQDRAAAIVPGFLPSERARCPRRHCFPARVNPRASCPSECHRIPGGQPHTYLAPLGQNSEGSATSNPTPAFPFDTPLVHLVLLRRTARGATEIDTGAAWS